MITQLGPLALLFNNTILCQHHSFVDVSIFWSKLSRILSKLDPFQIAISTQQMKVKTIVIPHEKLLK